MQVLKHSCMCAYIWSATFNFISGKQCSFQNIFSHKKMQLLLLKWSRSWHKAFVFPLLVILFLNVKLWTKLTYHVLNVKLWTQMTYRITLRNHVKYCTHVHFAPVQHLSSCWCSLRCSFSFSWLLISFCVVLRVWPPGSWWFVCWAASFFDRPFPLPPPTSYLTNQIHATLFFTQTEFFHLEMCNSYVCVNHVALSSMCERKVEKQKIERKNLNSEWPI